MNVIRLPNREGWLAAGIIFALLFILIAALGVAGLALWCFGIFILFWFFVDVKRGDEAP